MAIKGIVLDVYDTVLVKDAPVIDPFAYLFEQALDCGIVFDPKIEKYKILTQSMGVAGYTAQLFATQPEMCAPLVAATQVLLAQHIEAYRPRPEWQEFVAKAKENGLSICLGSNVATPFIDNIRAQLSQANQAVFSCDIGHAKPSPAFFQNCCTKMEIAPQETIMIGNSRASDITGARRAGFAVAFWLPEAGRGYEAEEFKRYNGASNLMEVLAHI